MITPLIAERIRQERQARYWTQHQLAQVVGCSAPTISRLENESDYPISDLLLVRLLYALEIDPASVGLKAEDVNVSAPQVPSGPLFGEFKERLLLLAQEIYQRAYDAKIAEVFAQATGSPGSPPPSRTSATNEDLLKEVIDKLIVPRSETP